MQLSESWLALNKTLFLSKENQKISISPWGISYPASRATTPISDDTEKPLRQKVYLKEQLRNICILSPYLDRLNDFKR